MHKIVEHFILYLSRIYVRILSVVRTLHLFSLPTLKPKNIYSQNRKSLIYVLFLVLFIFALYTQTSRVPANFPLGKLVTLESGQPLNVLAEHLEHEGVVRSAKALSIIIRLSGGEGNVHAGDYLFHRKQNIFSIARIINTGAFGLEPVRITVPEGVDIYDIATILETKILRFGKEKFIKEALPYEGYLFPDTYFFLPNATEDEIINTMLDNFAQQIEQFEDDIENSGKTLDEIVIMASIVEKEAHIHNDRKLIAGVLWSRLDINMPLQVDATFIYTHNKGSSEITMEELLDDANDYNTYKHIGLPPSAISSPSLSALKATIYPTDNPYLFYLADKYGKTYFSKTYEEHMRKRSQYISY